jgi:ApaG protein
MTQKPPVEPQPSGKKRGISYEADTDGVVVRVRPAFLDEESSPEDNHYIWAYHVEIENRGKRTFQLMTRRWLITDRDGRVQEVNGSGVVGQNPVLKPGERFEYTSGCPLNAPSGMMQGTYTMEDDFGAKFDVRIPLFALDSHYDRRAPN